MSDAAPGEFVLHILDVSYFSGKMQAYLRYKEIPHRIHEIDWLYWANVIYPNTGLMKVPVVQTPDGQWLQDTTPMIDWFEERTPEGAVLPNDPYLAFFCCLLEDYADEWLWRPALYYRWAPNVDAKMYGDRFSREFLVSLPGARRIMAQSAIRRQRSIYVKGDGVTAETRAHVESIYHRTLAQLEAIFSQQPFLLGQQPCLADFGFMASMFRHFSRDPTPSKIMIDTAPNVYAWVGRMWNARHSQFRADWPQPGILPQGWGAILKEVATCYLPYLYANAVAWREGRSRFDITLEGVSYRNLPTVRYRVWCRERLQAHLAELEEADRKRVDATLGEFGALEPLLRDGVLPSHLHEPGHHPAVCRPGKITRLDRATHLLTGSAWNERSVGRGDPKGEG